MHGLVYLGPPKCGTTSLYKFLPRSSNNFRVAIKEWWYLRRLSRGLDTYTQLLKGSFAPARLSFGSHITNLMPSKIGHEAAIELIHSAHICFFDMSISGYIKLFSLCPDDHYFVDLSPNNFFTPLEIIASVSQAADDLRFFTIRRNPKDLIRSYIAQLMRADLNIYDLPIDTKEDRFHVFNLFFRDLHNMIINYDHFDNERISDQDNKLITVSNNIRMLKNYESITIAQKSLLGPKLIIIDFDDLINKTETTIKDIATHCSPWFINKFDTLNEDSKIFDFERSTQSSQWMKDFIESNSECQKIIKFFLDK
jgi:hypothetical protein